MSVSLREVFSRFGYAHDAEQIALTKLASIRGCFDEKSKDKLISDEEAKKLLETPFDSQEEGIKWLCDVTQKKWLRASFQKEGIGGGKDPIINVERWLIQDPNPMSSNDEQQLLSMFKILGLIDTVKFPEKIISHVVVHGGMEEHANERINFIPDFSGRLYYMSNPRGLFNNEPSLAAILAAWFEKPASVNTIQAVLDKNKDLKTSDKHWLKNLEGLKADILEALGENNWPTGKGWYYKNPEPFDSASQNEKRQSLAGWPTAVDMVEYLLQQSALREPGKFKHIEICPIYSVRTGRVANTQDNIIDWYNAYGKELPENTAVAFISNNSRGLHYIHFQDVTLKETLNQVAKNKESVNIDVMTCGPGAEKISLSAATDVFAKIFYTKRPAVLQSLEIEKASTRTAYSQKDFNQFGLITCTSNNRGLNITNKEEAEITNTKRL